MPPAAKVCRSSLDFLTENTKEVNICVVVMVQTPPYPVANIINVRLRRWRHNLLACVEDCYPRNFDVANYDASTVIYNAGTVRFIVIQLLRRKSHTYNASVVNIS